MPEYFDLVVSKSASILMDVRLDRYIEAQSLKSMRFCESKMSAKGSTVGF
jgi:hypothetical protein